MLAEQVSPRLRLMQCISATIYVFLSAGVIFGFAAFKPIMIYEKVYESECDLSVEPTFISQLASKFGTNSSGIQPKCTNQDLKLNTLFTIAAALTNISSIFVGKILDVYGPKVCGLIGAALLYLACFIFISAESLACSYFDPYLVGFALMSLGGPFAFLASLQLSNAFPANSGTVLSILSCSFDASSSVFLGYKYVFQKSDGNFAIANFFQIYLLVPTFIAIAQLFIMNRESYLSPPATKLCADDDIAHHHVNEISENADETSPLIRSSGRRDSIGDAMKQHFETIGEDKLEQSSHNIFGILHGNSAKHQMKSWWFIVLTTLAILMMLKINYFVSTIRSQYTYLFDSAKKAVKVNNVFDIFLPLAGILTAPLIGLILDNVSTIYVLVLMLVTSILISLSGLVGNYYCAIFNVVMFSVYRPFFYACYADLFAKVFGFENFGIVYGSSMAIAGLMNLSQSFLDYVTQAIFDLNPIPVNVVLLAFTVVVMGIVTTFVYSQGKRYNKEKQLTL